MDDARPVFPGGGRLLAGVTLLLAAGTAFAGVGRTPGYADVSQGGEAAYSIPLKLPQGAQGLTPRLSLSYSSAVGQADAGVGWFVSGASAISRCAQTVAQDGAARDVRLDTNDRYCLDGNRLRAQSTPYGGNGVQYRTEIETYSRITSYDTAGNGPAYFIVEGRDGLKYEYGNTADSRIEARGSTTARAWALNRIYDRQGNDIRFSYAEDASNGGFRLHQVKYTGNTALGVTAPYAVTFVYESKPASEIDSGYFAGALVRNVVRLDRIDITHSSAAVVRSYDLTYESTLSGSGRSRLASIQECAGSPSDCLPATTFTYQNGSIGLGNETSVSATIPVGPGLPLDVNGDGREDLVYAGSTSKWMVMFANASGGFDTPVNTNIASTNSAQAITIDYNDDGKGDLLVPYSGSTWWVLLGSASGLAAPANTGTPVTSTGKGNNARALDINGDGTQDLVWADLVGYAGGDAIRYRAKSPGGGFSSAVTTVVGPLAADTMIQTDVFSMWSQRMSKRRPDFNGDGIDDLVYRTVLRIDVSPLRVNGTSDPVTMAAAATTYSYHYFINVFSSNGGITTTLSESAPSAPYFGDFNGDGKSDLLYYTQTGGWYYRYSTGLGFTGAAALGASVGSYPSWVIADWDGDGYDDALGPHPSSSTWRLARSNGEAFATPIASGVPLTLYNSIAVADVTGDGLLDLLYSNASGTTKFRPHSLDTSLPDLLATATDGYGTTAAYTYLPITHASVYTKGTGAVFPEVDVQVGRWVVQKLTATDGSGAGTTFDQTFSYEAARKHAQGRGFLGYAKLTRTDSRNGIRDIGTFRQAFPYIGALASRELKQSDGTRISYTQNTWDTLAFSTGFDARAYPYVKASSTDQHEVGGTANGVKFRAVTSTVASGGIDPASGLVKDVTTTTTEVATGLYPASSRTERTYHSQTFEDTANWCIGRPQRTEITRSHSLNFGTALTRVSDATWDGAACRVTTAYVEPGNATMEVRVDLGYDGYGNVASESVTGAGMTARVTQTSWGSDGRFPRTVTDPMGQVTALDWYDDSGLAKSSQDPNGLTTSWAYDPHDRRTLETRPDGTSTVWTYSTCSSGCDPAAKAQVSQSLRDSTGAVVRTDTAYVNRWDALTAQKSQLLTAGDTAWTTRREYDARGRLSREYVPHLTTVSGNGYRQMDYDLLDRVASESLYTAAGSFDRKTDYGYEGLKTWSTDPLSHTTQRHQAAWGDLLRVTDAANGQMGYAYDAFGQLRQATDPAGNIVSTVTYNARGLRTGLTDMDLGTWTFTPNALGELDSMRDAKLQDTLFGYDKLGRMTSRTEVEGTGIATATWTWGLPADNTATEKVAGRLRVVVGLGYSEVYTYDSLARLKRQEVNSDATYQFDATYNTLGALDTLTYPTSTASTRVKVKYGYTGGVLSSVQDYTGNVNGTVYWFLNLLDARGNAVSETFGNGLWLQNTFDPLTGEAATRQAGSGGQTTNVQNLAYHWDKAGNLADRQDLRKGLTESFGYDALHRLTSTSGPAAQALTIVYDAIGNVTSRTDIAGTFTYDPVRKHAVTSAGGVSYGYDANGNMSTRNGATIAWTSYNLPASLSASGYSASFNYAPDRSRWRQIATYTGATETTIYVAGLVEKLTTSTRVHWKHRIAVPSGEVQVVRRSDGTNDVFYITTDHLGSTDTVTDASATVLARETKILDRLLQGF